MQIIPLTQNQITIVDDEDFDYLSQWKWYADKAKSGKFYAVRNVYDSTTKKQTTLYLAHAIMLRINELEYHQKIGQDFQIDHINRNSLDNQRDNLRWCTRPQNAQNQSLRSNNSSGFKGVHKNRQLNKNTGKIYEYWEASIHFNNKTKYLGSFKSKIEASEAYNQKAKEFYGDFANPNFSDLEESI